MLSHHEKQEVINILNGVLGVGTSMKNDEQAHYCPFCHHHKPKLEVNFTENREGINQWACWACEKKGKTIRSLFKQARVEHLLKIKEEEQ